jgi:chromosomal replication initiation ATPase DnaA
MNASDVAAQAYAARTAIFDAAVDWAVEQSGLPRETILSKERREPVATWRQIAMTRCCENGLSRPETGRYFGFDQSTVTHAVRQIEKLADNFRAK